MTKYNKETSLYNVPKNGKCKIGNSYFLNTGKVQNGFMVLRTLYAKGVERFYSSETKVLVKGGKNA